MNPRIRLLLVAAAVVVLGGGCEKGKDGTDGHVYAYADWTGDIVAANFTAIGVPDPFFSGTRYQLIPSNARVYWTSNVTNYFLDVLIEDGTQGGKGKDVTIPVLTSAKKGDDGQDRVYDVLISFDTLYYSDTLVPVGTASATPSVLNALPDLDPATAQPGAFSDQMPAPTSP